MPVIILGSPIAPELLPETMFPVPILILDEPVASLPVPMASESTPEDIELVPRAIAPSAVACVCPVV